MESRQVPKRTQSPERTSIDFIGNKSPIAKRRRSDSKCPICLNPFADASIIRACEHTFCFECIRRWITQKPNCPLCKQRVDLIKHSFKCSQNFEPAWSDNGLTVLAREIIEEVEFKRLSKHSWPLDTELELIIDAIKKLDSMIKNYTVDVIKQALELKLNLLKLRTEAERKSRLDIICNPLFRFVIYFMDADRHSLITTHTDVNLTGQYVRRNRNRLRSELVPFVVREVNAITGLEAINLPTLMELLLNSFENPDQHRDRLFAYLKSIGVDHPRTFYRFVQEFASSDQSLHLYDSNSRYKLKVGLGPLFTDDTNDIQVISSQETDEVQFVGVSRTSPQIIILS